MKFERFIAKHILSSDTDDYAKPVIRISYISIALGLALMIISVAVVIGFKQTISSKIIGFTSHLQIVQFANNESLEEQPVNIEPDFIQTLEANPGIVHFQLCAKKAGVVKTKDQVQGVVFKGVGEDFDKKFLTEHLASGRFPDIANSVSDEVIVSSLLADKLEIGINDDLRTWFISGENSTARGRKFKIVGLFDTSLEEFDNIFVIGDIRHVQKLNNWDSNQVGSIEIMVDNAEDLQNFAFTLYESIPFNLRVVTVMEEYPQIFNWLDLLDMNVVVILILLIAVAAITMISTLLVLIMERTNMVGVLKALGANNLSIRRIFMYKAGKIILYGMLWGNIIGFGFYFMQYYLRLIRLSPESYYVDFVPVQISWWHFLLLNLGTLLTCSLMLIAPSFYITRIVPAKALRYN